MINHFNKENSYYAWYKARLTQVVKKWPLKNKYNPSSVDTDRPPDH
jgi:hypothetical protein